MRIYIIVKKEYVKSVCLKIFIEVISLIYIAKELQSFAPAVLKHYLTHFTFYFR